MILYYRLQGTFKIKVRERKVHKYTFMNIKIYLRGCCRITLKIQKPKGEISDC